MFSLREVQGQPGQWRFRRHRPTDEWLAIRVLPSPAPHQAVSGPPVFPRRSGLFLASARSLSESGLLGAASVMPRVRQEPQAVDVDREQVVGRGLKDVAVIVHLHDLGPVGGRAAVGDSSRASIAAVMD